MFIEKLSYYFLWYKFNLDYFIIFFFYIYIYIYYIYIYLLDVFFSVYFDVENEQK